MADEGFHEIQLNGKQLVFLFMAATVVAVVIFLCGVMVGRGVRVERPGALGGLTVEAATDPTAAAQTGPTTTTGSGGPSAASREDLTYPDRLGAQEPPLETLAPVSPPPAPFPDPVRRPRAPELTGDGFTVQVAAVRARGEADTIARRLTSRGYPAWVMTPANGAPSVFRVRVGRYTDRREAEAVAARLEREEHFKPWITR